jgi:hypothetical protein
VPGCCGLVVTVTGCGAALLAYAASLAAMTRRIRWPARNCWTTPGSVTSIPYVTSATRTGEISLFFSVWVPSGATS